MRKNETAFKLNAKKLDTNKHAPPVLDGAWGQGKGAGTASCVALVCASSKQSCAHKGNLASTLQTAHTSLEHYVLNSSVFQKGIVFFQMKTIG